MKKQEELKLVFHVTVQEKRFVLLTSGGAYTKHEGHWCEIEWPKNRTTGKGWIPKRRRSFRTKLKQKIRNNNLHLK